jgi:hypothetical protein
MNTPYPEDRKKKPRRSLQRRNIHHGDTEFAEMTSNYAP